MAVDYRLLQRFEASWYMEAALREAARGVAERRRQLMMEEEPSERPTVLVPNRVLRLPLAEDDR